MPVHDAQISTILAIFTLAIVSPGPNFIFVVNRSLTVSRRAGLYSALGVATGSGIFAVSGLLGLLLLITALPYFATLIRFLGGGYLVYLGLTMLLTARQSNLTVTEQQPVSTAPLSAYSAGLLTNLTNPKAWAFYLSLFTLMIENEFPFWTKVLLACSMFSISFCWYALMALAISDRRIQGRFISMQPFIKVVLGGLLTLLGGRLLLRG